MKRVLLDHCVPRRVRTALPDCDVSTTYERSWSELKNGELIRRAEAAGFEVFITADKNIRHQQNLRSRRIAVLLLPTNTLRDLLPMFSSIADAVARAQSGGYEELP